MLDMIKAGFRAMFEDVFKSIIGIIIFGVVVTLLAVWAMYCGGPGSEEMFVCSGF